MEDVTSAHTTTYKEKHKQVICCGANLSTREGFRFKCDAHIEPIIFLFNVAGIKTKYSCEGKLYGSNYGSAYIWLYPRSRIDLKFIWDTLAEHEEWKGYTVDLKADGSIIVRKK